MRGRILLYVALAAGSVKRALGAIVSVQIATSLSARAAHDFGGGGGGLFSPSLPAIRVSSVVLPSASGPRWKRRS